MRRYSSSSIRLDFKKAHAVRSRYRRGSRPPVRVAGGAILVLILAGVGTVVFLRGTDAGGDAATAGDVTPPLAAAPADRGEQPGTAAVNEAPSAAAPEGAADTQRDERPRRGNRVRRTLQLPAPSAPSSDTIPVPGATPAPGKPGQLRSAEPPAGAAPTDDALLGDAAPRPPAGDSGAPGRAETARSAGVAPMAAMATAGMAVPVLGRARAAHGPDSAPPREHVVGAAGEPASANAGTPAGPPPAAHPAAGGAADAGTGDSNAGNESQPAAQTQQLLVGPGDSLDRLFRRHGLSVADLHAMLSLAEAERSLRLIRPGDEIDIRRQGSAVLRLTRRLDDFHLLEIERASTGASWHAEVIEELPERRVVHAAGRITSSLFNAGRAAGISDNLVMKLAGIFAWDIDFVLDIREGDEFTVLYEELWRDGQKLRDGAILAAEFVNDGRRFQALRYVDPEGEADYFTPDGLNVRKAFLRAPVDFTRISSNFNPRRRHPVLNTIRAHRGVDYAAPPGTPIRAAGDGRVAFRGVKGGYGNVVILEHGDNISTLYAHMSRFGRYGRGARVHQGDIIGYVGASGRVTGPHLHYEYRVAGVHRNPRTVELPEAKPVAPAYRADFLAHAEHLLAQLELVKSVRLAEAR